MTKKQGKRRMTLRGVRSKNKQEKYEAYNGLCWGCRDDQLTQESEFEEDMI